MEFAQSAEKSYTVAHVMEVFKMKPTIEQLNESWESFLKEGIYIDQRYGQWHYNLYKHEVGNSYNIERPYKAYQVLYDDIVNNGGDSEESK